MATVLLPVSLLAYSSYQTGHIQGTCFLVSPYVMHRLPEFWGDDVDLFKPERFLDSDTPANPAFMPFISGPRSCIGSRFALMEMEVLLVVTPSHVSEPVFPLASVIWQLTLQWNDCLVPCL